MRLLACAASLLALTSLLAPAEEDKDKKKDEVIVINITGGGGKAKYVKEGDTEQKDVTVTVGRSVKWVNKGNKDHSATSSLKGKDDKPLFETGDLAPDKSSKPVEFTQKLYEAAGGKDGKPVTLEYFCTVHGKMNMKSNIILTPGEEKKQNGKTKEK